MQRSDALKNRKDLLAAARAVFAEHGTTAPLDLVRQRADVGRATLYRHFADRQALMLALVDDAMEDLSDQALEFDALLRRAARAAASDEVIHAIWGDPNLDPADVTLRRERLSEIFKQPLQRARDRGEIRDDFTASDIPLALRMIGGAARIRDGAHPEVTVQRACDLLMDGLRPRG